MRDNSTLFKDNNTLLKNLQNGDESALDEIISTNMGLVKSISLRFCGRGTDYEDLVQIGSIGLLRAARSFDFSYGCVFSTYAVPLIIGEIKRFLRDDGIIKVSRNIKSDGIMLMKKREEFSRLNGRDPSVCELAALCGITPEQAACTLEATTPVASLSDKESGDDRAIEDCISDDSSDFDSITERMALSEAIRTLTPEQQKILRLRYNKDLSQQKTGEILGITQVKVSREEKRIMEKLKKILA